MKRIALFIGTLLLAVTASAQQYDADFTQTRTLKLSGKTTVKTGHILFDGKDQLSMLYFKPDGDYFIIDGPLVRMDMDGKQAEINATKIPLVGLQRATLLNCLSGNWKQVAEDNHATASVTEKGGLRTVSLTAQKVSARGGYKSVTLTYRIKDGKLTRMVLEEAAGIENTYEIK